VRLQGVHALLLAAVRHHFVGRILCSKCNTHSQECI
jgi:hypothetical protein